MIDSSLPHLSAADCPGAALVVGEEDGEAHSWRRGVEVVVGAAVGRRWVADRPMGDTLRSND